jgi:TonB family protein
MAKGSALAVCAVSAIVAAQTFAPPRFRDGAMPALPVNAVGGGDVFVELTIDRSGGVAAATTVRTTPPFTDAVVGAVATWRFSPARGTSGPARTLVAAIFRPPALIGPTLGEPPRDGAPPSDDVAFPIATVVPAYPPAAVASGVVLVEARVDPDGSVGEATVVKSTPPFDEESLKAARAMRFRPARRDGQAESTFVYLLFGFPRPVTGS